MVARGGAGISQAARDFGVGGGKAFRADFHTGVEVALELLVPRETATHDGDGVLAERVAFDVVEHAACHRVVAINVGDVRGFCGTVAVVLARLLLVGTAFLDVVHGDFTVVLLDVFTLVGLELPLKLLGGVCHEGNAEGGVEFQGDIVEHLEGFAHDRSAALGDAVAVIAEVRIHGVGLLGGNSHDLVSVLFPHLADSACAGLLVRGGLGDRDEVVDLGSVGLGGVVSHERLLLGFVFCPPWRTKGLSGQQKALDKVFIKRRCCAVNAKMGDYLVKPWARPLYT